MSVLLWVLHQEWLWKSTVCDGPSVTYSSESKIPDLLVRTATAEFVQSTKFRDLFFFSRLLLKLIECRCHLAQLTLLNALI